MVEYKCTKLTWTEEAELLNSGVGPPPLFNRWWFMAKYEEPVGTELVELSVEALLA